MQVEIDVHDKNVQTSPREEDKPKVEEIVTSADVVPPVAEQMVTDIIHRMPIKIPTETQKTETEKVATIEQVTQTSPRQDIAQVSRPTAEPYEINIETSIIVPGDVTTATATVTKPSDTSAVVEIQKTFVIDDTQPGNVREIESSTTEKGKKPKSKKKKKRHSGGDDKHDEPVEIKASVEIEQPSIPIESLELQQDKPKATKVTINVTKTTVYDTTNVIGIEEVLSDDNEAEPLAPGNFFLNIIFLSLI